MSRNLNNLHALPEAPAGAELVAAGELDSAEELNTYPPASAPMPVARRLLTEVFAKGGHYTLTFWRQRWWQYTGTHYREVDELTVERPMWKRLEEVTVVDTNGNHKAWTPTKAKVASVLHPMKVETHMPTEMEAPMWRDNPHKGVHLVPMNNGLLDLNSRQLQAHTSNYFTTWALGFDYQEQAQCPHWEKFVGEVFEHDPNAALLLQEYMGYLVSGRTNMHKALMIVGVGRAGKGTIQRVLTALMGQANVAAPSLNSLNEDFGAESLIGKPLAILADARDGSSRFGGNRAVERILNIVGEDTLSINRKGEKYWVGRLPTRIVLMSNENPRFTDASGAIANRFVGFRLVRSFEGVEDRHLDSKLKAELPGIFLWCLEGLERLRRQGRFTVPETQAELLTDIKAAAAPVTTFVSDTFEVTGQREDWLPLTDVFARYRTWCDANGHHPTTSTELGNRIKAANIPGVTLAHTLPPGALKKNRYVMGVKLNSFF